MRLFPLASRRLIFMVTNYKNNCVNGALQTTNKKVPIVCEIATKKYLKT